MNDFNYVKAASVEDGIKKINSENNSSFLAGGTNKIDLWKYDIAHPDTLIDLNGLEDLKEIKPTPDGGLTLGALASNADTAWHPEVERRYPLLSKTILAGASAQIRNMATNGGNLLQRTRCYYFYDVQSPCNKRKPGSGCPALTGLNRMHAILGTSESCIAVFPSDMSIALAALEATIHVQGSAAKRKISLSEFHRLPGDTPVLDNNLKADEIITGIELPPEGFADHYSYLKLRDKNSYAFALVSVATGLKLKDNKIEKARIALGGVAHKPWRVPAAENFLEGKEPNRENFGAAADIILQGAKGFEHNTFKINLARESIIRNGIMALNPTTQRPGAQPSL